MEAIETDIGPEKGVRLGRDYSWERDFLGRWGPGGACAKGRLGRLGLGREILEGIIGLRDLKISSLQRITQWK